MTLILGFTNTQNDNGGCIVCPDLAWPIDPLLSFLSDEDWEVCLHTLRLLQSVLAVEEEEEEAEEGRPLLGGSLLDPELRARVSQLTYRGQSSLRLAAHQTLEDLEQVLGS